MRIKNLTEISYFLIANRRNLQGWRFNRNSDLLLLTCYLLFSHFFLTCFSFSLYDLIIDRTFTNDKWNFIQVVRVVDDGRTNIYKVFRGFVNNKYKDGKDLWHLTFLSSFTIHLVASSLSHVVYVVLLILNFYCYIKFL